MSTPRCLLVKVKGAGPAFAAAQAFGAGRVSVETILKVPDKGTGSGQGIAPQGFSTWLRVEGANLAENPWDAAHELLTQGGALGFGAAAMNEVDAVEPDLDQQWLYQDRTDATDGTAFAAATAADRCAFEDQDSKGNKATATKEGVAWNFGNDFSGLKAARDAVGEAMKKVIIAHLDTGFDPLHQTCPANLLKDLQCTFIKNDPRPDSATDITPADIALLRNRGHGTGTLSLLAGNKLGGDTPGWTGFTDYVGVAPLARILAVRIADSVVRFSTSTMVQGFDYAREKGAHVLTMSMGGMASDALADAVNLAYEAGIFMVAASGDNFALVPTPKTTVFPARFRRVLSACGVMADGRAYAGLAFKTMQGNFGPDSKMDTSLGAYSPNVPWAKIDCGKIVDMDGGGTSASTPQIAGAAALWLAQYFDQVMKYPEAWMRVEAVRHALFTSAAKSTARMDEKETFQKLGQGVLKAAAALQVQPVAADKLVMLPPAKTSFPFLNVIFGGGGVSLAFDSAAEQRRQMLRLELTQMAQRVPEVEATIADPDTDATAISPAARNRYLEAALDAGTPSKPLRAVLEQMLARPGVAAASSARAPQPAIKRHVKCPDIQTRRLRVYALDPSLAKSLDSFGINETILPVPWDDSLKPGPIGEYLEVIDVDPASNKVYDPVDLNNNKLLAQDGWPPSEGNPQFHQQMVYAVAMTTIGHFERALGRRALWAPHRVLDANGKGKPLPDEEVRRLRIYPHALRTANAYYSPDKKALLFGYFPSNSTDNDSTAPGSTVFACLSSDIVAHETTHALLDGLQRRYEEASNPDVPAFHEGFADIVALFQHFTIPELVRFEIARARGDLTIANLLGGLAKQFGEGSSRGGPLRNYLDPEMLKLTYQKTLEAHERGSLLVYAVYEAFLKAVAFRTESTIRVATGGSGILAPGSLNPGLVDRLAEETSAAAAYVLQMCIRALDYCPAVDITFGEYLRALITADRDLVPQDRFRHRVAFLEAFRNRGILPRDVRTVSEETISWSTVNDPRPGWLTQAMESINLGWGQDLGRSEIFKLNDDNRWALWRSLQKVFVDDPTLYSQFGLLPDLPRYDSKGQVWNRPEKGKSTYEVFSVRPARRVAPDGSFRTEVIAVIHQRRPIPLDGKDVKNGFFWFRGGATLIIDPRPGKEEIRYCIVKRGDSDSRLARQLEYMTTGSTGNRALYFGRGDSAEPFAMMHSNDGDRPNG